jgi:Zn-dependent alcohol dehydrogenase
VVHATLDSPTLQAIGTLDPQNRLSVLLVNSGGSGIAVVSGLAPNSNVRIVTHDKSGNKFAAAKASPSGAVGLPVPMRSVVSVLSGK